MINSKVFELLKTFSSKEFRLLGEYINSPIHNKNENLIQLYKIIRRYYPSFSSRNFKKEKIYLRLFPENDYNDNRLRKIFSALLYKSMDFLAYYSYESTPVEKGLSLLKILSDKDQEELFEKKLKETNNYIKKHQLRSEYLRGRFLLENRKNVYKSQKNLLYRDNFELNESENLIRYFLLNIMRRYSALLNKKYDLKIDFKPSMLPEILKFLKIASYDDVPELHMYYHLITLVLDEENENNLVALIKYIKRNYRVLETQDLFNAYSILGNLYLKKHDKGCSKFAIDLFEIYKNQLAANAHKTGRYMSHILYRNIADVAIRVKDFKWAEKFINEYKSEIQPDYRENSFNYLTARLNFFTNNLQKTMEYITKIKYDDYYHKLDMYTFKLRIYYETNADEALLSLVDSYKHFLAKDNFIPGHRMNEYKSFLRFILILIKMKMSGNYSRLTYYKNELLKVHQVNCTGWFIDKFFELERKHAK